jgi:hypothetical protein
MPAHISDPELRLRYPTRGIDAPSRPRKIEHLHPRRPSPARPSPAAAAATGERSGLVHARHAAVEIDDGALVERVEVTLPNSRTTSVTNVSV